MITVLVILALCAAGVGALVAFGANRNRDGLASHHVPPRHPFRL